MPVDPAIMKRAREFIGHSGQERAVEITRKEIIRFAISIGDKNPAYRDPEYARALGYRDIIGPPMFHCVCSLPEAELDDLEPSGLGANMGPRFDVPVPGFTGAVAGGRDITLGVPFYPGDVITAKETVVDVFEKEGKAGPMIFIVSEHRFTNQNGEACVVERQTVIRHQ